MEQNNEQFTWNGHEEILEVWEPQVDLQLKPCPFCGEQALFLQYTTPVGPRWRVTCCGCMATIDPGYAQNRHIVQERWNNRITE